jgi:RNA polymerase sigma factor (sigma-70 family)
MSTLHLEAPGLFPVPEAPEFPDAAWADAEPIFSDPTTADPEFEVIPETPDKWIEPEASAPEAHDPGIDNLLNDVFVGHFGDADSSKPTLISKPDWAEKSPAKPNPFGGEAKPDPKVAPAPAGFDLGALDGVKNLQPHAVPAPPAPRPGAPAQAVAPEAADANPAVTTVREYAFAESRSRSASAEAVAARVFQEGLELSRSPAGDVPQGPHSSAAEVRQPRPEFQRLPSDMPDGSLLQRFVINREERAFTTLVQRHQHLVLGICQRVLGDSHAALDAFQATFLVLARKAGMLDRDGSLAGWLYKVAYRLALRLRTVAARQRHKERQAAGARPAHDDSEVAADLEQEEMREALSEELQRLPDKYRLPLVLCYFDGHTHDEAARAIGLPRGSMAKRIGEGLERLRERLTDRGFML